MSCPITSLSIVPKGGSQEQGYKYKPLNDAYDIKTSIYDDNLPLAKFRANNAKPCMDMLSATSFETSYFRSEYFQYNEYENVAVEDALNGDALGNIGANITPLTNW